MVFLFPVSAIYRAIVPWNTEFVLFLLLQCQNKARIIDLFFFSEIQKHNLFIPLIKRQKITIQECNSEYKIKVVKKSTSN